MEQGPAGIKHEARSGITALDRSGSCQMRWHGLLELKEEHGFLVPVDNELDALQDWE